MTQLNPETYLETQGVELKRSSLIYMKGDFMVVYPNFERLLDGYHKAKLSELDLKITPEDGLYDAKIIQMPVNIGAMDSPIDGYPDKF